VHEFPTQDWLGENGYTQNNVADWDFYNVLTDPDNLHRFQEGTVASITQQSSNTLNYSSNGDIIPTGKATRKPPPNSYRY